MGTDGLRVSRALRSTSISDVVRWSPGETPGFSHLISPSNRGPASAVHRSQRVADARERAGGAAPRAGHAPSQKSKSPGWLVRGFCVAGVVWGAYLGVTKQKGGHHPF